MLQLSDFTNLGPGLNAGMQAGLQSRSQSEHERANRVAEARAKEADIIAAREREQRYQDAAEQARKEKVYRDALGAAIEKRMAPLANARPVDYDNARAMAFKDTMHLLPTAGGISNAFGAQIAQQDRAEIAAETAQGRISIAEIRAAAAEEQAKQTARTWDERLQIQDQIARRKAETSERVATGRNINRLEVADVNNASREGIAAGRNASANEIAEMKNLSNELRTVIQVEGKKKSPMSKMEFVTKGLPKMLAAGINAADAEKQLSEFYDIEAGVTPRPEEPVDPEIEAAEKALELLKADGKEDFNVFLNDAGKPTVRKDAFGISGDSSGISYEAAKEKLRRIREARGSVAPPSTAGRGRQPIRIKAADIQ